MSKTYERENLTTMDTFQPPDPNAKVIWCRVTTKHGDWVDSYPIYISQDWNGRLSDDDGEVLSIDSP